MFRTLLTAVAAATLLAACGGGTSIYFCSGSDEFCDRTRRTDDNSTSTADPASQASTDALDVARKTPVLVEQSLGADSLTSALDTTPDVVGGWLLAASFGLLVDDTDNAAASRFFDQNRYWLTSTTAMARDSEVLDAGMLLLASVAQTRDPAVAEQARVLTRGVALAWTEPAPDVGATARSAVTSREADGCCSTTVLAAAAVVLCDDLGLSDPSAADGSVNAQACAVARGWLTELTR